MEHTAATANTTTTTNNTAAHTEQPQNRWKMFEVAFECVLL